MRAFIYSTGRARGVSGLKHKHIAFAFWLYKELRHKAKSVLWICNCHKRCITALVTIFLPHCRKRVASEINPVDDSGSQTHKEANCSNTGRKPAYKHRSAGMERIRKMPCTKQEKCNQIADACCGMA